MKILYLFLVIVALVLIYYRYREAQFSRSLKESTRFKNNVKKVNRFKNSLKEEISKPIAFTLSPKEDHLAFSERIKKWSNLYYDVIMSSSFISYKFNILSLHQGQIGSDDIAIFDIDCGEQIVQRAVYFHSDLLNLPHFCMRPMGFWGKIGIISGKQNICFNESPKFSSNYRLTGDERKVCTLFRSKAIAMSYFENYKDWSVEGLGTQLLVYRGPGSYPMEDQVFLRQARLIFHMLC